MRSRLDTCGGLIIDFIIGYSHNLKPRTSSETLASLITTDS